jgi:cell division transport system permease protein
MAGCTFSIEAAMVNDIAPATRNDEQASESWADTPLVPASSVAGAALSVVIAIMTFLAALTAGFAMLLTQASQDWRGQVGLEMTIQIMPRPGRDLDADSRKAVEITENFPGLGKARALTKGQSEDLLAPWLGAGLDLSQLPVPRLIELKRDESKQLDEIGLRAALDAALPNANLDNHSAWMRRLSTMADVVVASALGVFALVLTAMGLAVGFATRGAMAGAKEIIEALHFVGAADSFIAAQFQRHFLRLGLRGGVIGGGAAAGLFLALGGLSRRWTTSAGGEQAEAMFGAFSLGWGGLAAIAALSLGVALLTGVMSRIIVHRSLRQMN